MKKTIGLTLMVLSFGALANAEEAQVDKAISKESSSETKVDKYTRKVVVTRYDGSRANREGKKISLDASILGLSFGTNSMGVSVGKFLNNDTILKLEYTSLDSVDKTTYDEESSEEKDIWAEDGKGYALSVGAKVFTGNSFYIEPSVYYRKQVDVNSVSTLSIGDSDEVIDVEREDITDTGLGFKIGNQWQFKNFTLGCDWVGLTKTLAVLDYKVSGDRTRDYETSLSLLNFYLGASF